MSVGAYGSYKGNKFIADEKKEELTNNIIKLLYYGGMMQLEEISMYGNKIVLIEPVALNKNGDAAFNFNYFEDNAWDDAAYKSKNCSLSTEQIGYNEFCTVVTAAYFLYEFYDDGIGVTEVNMDFVDNSIFVGWINHILGTNFSMKKRLRLWDIYEYINLEIAIPDGSIEDIVYDITDVVPGELLLAMGGIEFSDICYIINGTESLQNGKLKAGSYPEAVYKCKEALIKYFEDSHDDETDQIDQIWKIVTNGKKVRENLKDEMLRDVAEMSLSLPARVLVYLTCEIKNLNFWYEWMELHKNVYHDETVQQYAPDNIIAERTAAIEAPIEPVTTSDFLREDYPLMFWNTPEELKGKPNYYLSDDDRVFWWDGSEEVVFSKDMNKWLTDLSVRHKQFLEDIPPDYDKENFLKKLILALVKIEAYYKRVYAFQNMFYDFLQNGADKRYFAAVLLMEELAEENKEAGKIIEKAVNWDSANKNITHNEGRITMKRYLGVMANQRLREKYFGF